jgi:hypothetical protein
MGWNGAGTYGVRVDSARVSDNTTGNAATVTNGVYTSSSQNNLSGILNFGSSGATPYLSPTGTSNGISFGGIEASSLRTYGIFTEQENIGGNYSKLTINYHTGIRIGAMTTYGGTRFYNNFAGGAGGGTEIFSVGNGDNHVRVAYNLYVASDIVYNNMKFTGDQTYGFLGRNVYADTINGRGADPLELNYYDGGSVIIGSGTGSKALYAGSLFSANSAVLTVANYSSYAGGLTTTNTWTGAQNNFIGNGNTGSTNNVGLVVYSTGGNGAQMSFHRSGAYAINMGLDSDNVFRIGGWSAGPNRLQLDMSGNLTVPAAMYMDNAYNTGWFRNYGDSGVYNQDYGSHFRRSTSASHGTWEVYGYNKGGYCGINVIDNSGFWNNLMFENGQGGIYVENGSGWTIYLSRANDCVGINGSETYDWVRACTNGKHRITNDTWCDAISYAVSFNPISDARLKENVVTVDNALNKILQLRGVYYSWIIDTEQKAHIGVIAQEVQEVCPEAVLYHEETDTLTVSYNDLSGIFIEGFKELNQKLTDANARIELLETKINQLLNA